MFRKTGVPVLVCALLILPAAAPGQAAGSSGRAAAPASDGPDPIDFAVVVDQSESLSEEDLAREVEAASLITQGEISGRSRAAVIGFGSSEKPGQSPVSEVCALTTADTAGRQRLSDCVQQLAHRDDHKTGPGTDFPAAVRQAVDRLAEKGDKEIPKVVFLLTDGRLDVSDSPEYGADQASRQANGAKRLTEELARARRESVQIWPLGFGDSIDRAALTRMAEGGFRGGCADLPDAAPKMRVVDSSAQIDKALQETFAAARCARVAHGTVGKPPADLSVTIPPIATDGSLTVSKHDPKVTVTYYDPKGRRVPTQGEFDGSAFETSGQDGPVEALRVKNPLPGKWRVHIEAPEGHRDREVAVRAIWQGRLRSAVTLSPASPRPGEEAVVEVRMQTRRGVVITDPEQLKGIRVSARMTGAGFDPVVVPLADGGRKPDERAEDARYAGRFTVPATASGELRLTTEMTAPGITSDRRPLHARISQGTPVLTAGLSVDRGDVHPRQTVSGTLDVTNNDSGPHTLRLSLADQPPGSALRITPATVNAAPGGSSTPFTVTLGPGVPLGELSGRITVTDLGDGGRVVDNVFLGVRVTAEPTLWDRWWWAFTGSALLLCALAAVVAVRLRAGARRRDLSGVRLELRVEGQRPDTLTIRAGQSTGGEFLFGVGRAGDGAPALRRGGGSQAYRLRRTAAGQLLLKPPGGPERAIGQGQPAGLADGFELVVGDARTASRPGRPGRDGQARGQGGGPFGRRRVPGPRGPRPQGSTDRTGPRGGRTRGDASAAPPRRGTTPPDPHF
ncbi:VWA domain-containing protein [Streptomyces sp. Tu 2975]|uniref:VWA domain-containing protein n=1 Tax=Streptomyces sp. Tu 2975 TaxID=2676871 RepID=UPI001FC98CFB|nr:VWA domain-containing protein [Streptomyces sp. Tu 2975]